MSAQKYDVLRIDPTDKPIYLLVSAHGSSDLEQVKYFYEEHKCPSDILMGVDTVIIDGDSDPHGLLEFVRTIEVDFSTTRPPGQRYSIPDIEWRRALPEAFPAEEVKGTQDE